ncbi:hypothetical protein PRUPE_2G266500 [Prunus persica]|uniref:Uncharacterized protein n=1 Tax=Prunus persica TaxID=3760 RepID=A0A251QM11_PRUPE|nr:hypothetical protein PRUPE_2G266500 [Prunus persica]
MSKPSSRIIQGLLRFHHNQIAKPSSPLTSSRRTYHSNNGPLPQFPSHPKPVVGGGGSSSGPGLGLGLGLRFFSFKPPNFSKVNAKKVFDKPLSAATSAFSRYQEAIGLQIEAFWKRNNLVLLGVGALVVCALLWRVMFGIASTFVGLSEGMAKYGFLALSSAIVAFAYDMKLLAVDIPMASGPDQRLFLIGDEEEYKVGGGLIAELRDPVVKAMAATKEFDSLDQIEEEEDAERELQEAERKHREEIEKLEKDGSQ